MTVQTVVERLSQLTRAELHDVAGNTGLGKEWIYKLSRNEINDPGARKIEKLSAYFNKVDADAKAA